VLPADPGQYIQRPEVVPNEEAGVVIVRRSIDEFVIALRLDAAEIAFGDEVRDAADRVRPISRGGAVLEYLDPIECEQRNQVGVGKPGAGRWDITTIVEKDQRALRTQPAQIDRSDALKALAGSGELVGIAQNRATGGKILDEFERVGDTACGKFLGSRDFDRKRRIVGRSADQRSGDDDVGAGCSVFLGVLRQRRSTILGQGRHAPSRSQREGCHRRCGANSRFRHPDSPLFQNLKVPTVLFLLQQVWPFLASTQRY